MQTSTTTLEKNLEAFKYLHIYLPYDPAIPFLGIYPKECDTGYSGGIAHPYLLQHYSQQPSYGSSQDAPLLMNRLRKCGIYTKCNSTQP
jgi:hypothetical protein